MKTNDTEIEKTVLATIMHLEDAYFEGFERLSEEHFTTHLHKEIYNALEEIISRNTQPDMFLVLEIIKRKNIKIENLAYELTGFQSVMSNIHHLNKHINVLEGYYVYRKSLQMCSDINRKIKEGLDPLKLVTEIEDKLSELQLRQEADSKTSSMKECNKEIVIWLESEKNNILNTYFDNVDRVLGGMEKGNVVYIAARPSVGKTSLVQSLALQFAEHKHPCHIFSLEMTKEELTKSFISQRTGIDRSRLKNKELSKEEYNRILQELERMDKLQIYIDDLANLNYQTLRAKAKRIMKKYGTQVIMVDYMQLMGTNKQGTREREISELSRNLKILAKELNIVIIILSQLSREVEKRASNEPMLSDLRESGSLEQDANIVIFIYRPNDPGLDNENVRMIKIAKNRAGKTGITALKFTGESVRFEDYHGDYSHEITGKKEIKLSINNVEF